ncbi:hypothetical protein D3C71_1305350 [compost metagenome]
MAHQGRLALALPRIGLLPLLGHPLRDDVRTAVVAILDHAVNAQGGELFVAARFGTPNDLHCALGNGWQKAPGQQTEVGLIDHRPDRLTLVQAHIGQLRPGGAVVAIHRDGGTDFVQRHQQIQPSGIGLQIAGLGAEGLTLAQHLIGLVAVDAVVVPPATDQQRTAQPGQQRTAEQHATFVPRHLEVVPGQPRLRVNHPPQQMLCEVHHRMPLGLGRADRRGKPIGPRRGLDKQVGHNTTLVNRRQVNTPYQGWCGVAVTAQYIAEKTQQNLP